MTAHEKLVRDRIPELMATEGIPCQVRGLNRTEYATRLDDKLTEEVAEYRASGAIEELVDVVEVVRAIVEQRGMPWDEFEARRLAKRRERGGFEQRFLLTRSS